MTTRTEWAASPDAGARPLVERILDERARALAQPLEDPDRGAVLALTFRVGEQVYALEARHVREVVPRPAVARLGAGAGRMAGVVNVRGQVVPVADLRDLLGPPAPRPAPGAVVVLDGHDPLGLLADEVGDLVHLHPDELVPPPLEDAHGGLLAAVGRRGLVIDGPALLGDGRLRVADDGSNHAVEPTDR